VKKVKAIAKAEKLLGVLYEQTPLLKIEASVKVFIHY
jgi:hypothetical protein